MRVLAGGVCAEVADESRGLTHIGDLLQRVARFISELAPVEIERGPSFPGHYRKAERNRHMRHIRAADVEGPGQRWRIGNHQDLGAQLAELLADAHEFAARILAGIAGVMQRHRSERRVGAILPDGVDRVRLNRHQGCAGRGAGLAQSLGVLRGMQPGVIAELGARRQVSFQPFGERLLRHMLDAENIGVGLLARLQGIAAVCEQHRAIRENQRIAGRAGEAGEPGESFLGCGQIFALMAVGMRHQESVESAPLQFRAQRRHPRRGGCAACGIVESLEFRFVHCRHFMGRRSLGQCALTFF